MYEILKYIADYNNWIFEYARKDFHNLYNEAEQKNTPHLFVDPIQITEGFDEYNNVISTNYSGSFMLLLSSNIDEEDYNYRYQSYIKPIIEDSLKLIKEGIKCDGENLINNWRIIEVINAFDYNFDGVIITYSIDG
ncbi:hypothetical protein BA195_10195 [Tenacibaculum soleae]|uniref:Uncharacterized protein n=1 Tax=Tenacibaculum soleae TaxID=447689 RepID=A0A1B9XY86_9FLAO|nr:hypothetical protein [Tenacibaculum soleae]OCK42537.1 hypothetical protein BA195_10195 [Tenacibaculum soleae]